jgi:hypothetical protein
MPTYKFTSPDGVEYYGEGASPMEAFQAADERSAAEVAAMRQRQAVQPSGGRQESEFTGQLENALVPGLGAVRSTMRGDYGEAAGEAAISALPLTRFLPKAVTAPLAGAVAGSTGMSPSAIAEEPNFSFIEDPAEREAALAQYKGLKGYIKDKRTGESSPDRGETARLRQEFMREQQGKASERAKTKREAAEKEAAEKGALERFEERNKATVEALTPEQRAQYDAREVPGNVMATITNRAEYLQQVEAQKEQSRKGFAERNPEAMEWLQKGSYAASAGIPIATLAHRASTLRTAAKEAEDAYLAAIKGSRSKATTTANEGTLALRANQLEEASKLNPLDKSMIAASPFIPVAAAEAPNFIDLAQLQNQPDSPAFQHAQRMINPLSPEAQTTAGRALGEGLTATAAGFGLGEPISRFPVAKAGATGTLKTIRTREEAMARAAADAAEAKRLAADAKRMAREAPKLDAAARAQADDSKRAYADKKREEALFGSETGAAQDAAEAAAQRQQIKALKPNRPRGQKKTEALEPGAGSPLT